MINTCPQNYKFEGKERDTETQNDDFGAREYSWRFGRWLSSDWSAVLVAIPYANLNNPQTLNLYAMASDDPESFADLDGHWITPAWWQHQANQGNSAGQAQSQATTKKDQEKAQNHSRETATVIVTKDSTLGVEYGSHTAVFLNNTPDGPALYDPAGSYKNDTRGSGGIITQEEGASLSDYVKYQQSTGSKVETYTFQVSAADQAKIYQRAEAIGDPRGLSCASSVTQAIKGIGPFSSVQTTGLPGKVAEQMQSIQWAIALDKARQWVVKTVF